MGEKISENLHAYVRGRCEKTQEKDIGPDTLPAGGGRVDLAGDVACDPVADHFALNGRDFSNNFLVVVKVAVEAFSVLFEKGNAH
ncbi:hypothetical protein ASJ83_02660 [Methanocorpusculum parvum]|uniref:Uncharacterized protein n=1 Tax=Methanocorpusculum parvum TaxID=2193 RepID=A0AAX0Q813_9EURY|nr:hypothetical protein ASJ83_02660 [Methanocorpusculum parvum]